LTFVNDQLATNQTLGIAATAKYNAIAPTGIVGLPIKDGVSTGVDLARYAPFSWSISTNGSLGSTKFDLELTAAGDTSDFNSTNKLVEDARIIRRVGGVGDIANTWFLQGTQYDNFIIGGVPTVTNVNSVGGLLTGGAIFTYGLKSTLVITNAIAPQTLTAGSTAFTRDLNVPAVFGGSTTAFTYTAQSSNTNVATVSLTGSVLKVTPVGAGTAVVTVTGSTTDQGQIQTSFAVTVNPGAVAVSGKVVYDNAATTGIGLATVTLTPATGSAIQVAADTAGNYSFANVASGSYTLSATKAGTWAGANSTDALQVVRAYAGLTTLDALATQAADVNNSGSVNATDALLIVQRFAGVITTFAKGDWTFQQIPVTVGSTSLTAQVVKGLTVGDVNKSNTTTGASFAKSAVSDVVMSSDKSVGAASKAAFEIPMTSANAMTVGAVSLKINYPADQVTFTGVSSSKLSGVIAKAEDGVITIGWANMDVKSAGAELKENDVLLSLAFTAKNDKGTVTLTAGAGSQIADAAGNTISLAKLSANTVEVGTVPTEFELAQNYPNPFNPSTEIRYAVAQAGKVTLAIYNVMGQEVSRLVSGQQEAGVYKVRWNASGMASGVYIYRLQVDDKFTASKRLTLLK
jgi:hypothetical protein